MSAFAEHSPGKTEPVRAAAVEGREYVCWTRMQAEAGESLTAILERKERERSVGRGVFMWGVGNAPPLIVRALARSDIPVTAVFSVMKSRPRSIDTAPPRSLLWRAHIDAHGIERLLPPHALVTSRGDTVSGAKVVHYALMCHSDRPLVLEHGRRFDPRCFRNAAGNHGPVAPSQVTALVRRVQVDHASGDYEANLTVMLTDSYWVRLTDPVELSPAEQALVTRSTRLSDVDRLRLVAELRCGPPLAAHNSYRQGTLI
jgi:hypothetical protein